jgi:hypothetical protein
MCINHSKVVHFTTYTKTFGFHNINSTKKLNSVALVREQTIKTEQPLLVGEVVPTFADRGCHVVRAMDSHGH